MLAQTALRYGIRLDDAQIDRFRAYLALLQEWSPRANLVSDASEDVVVRRHFVESLALGAALRQREILRPSSRVLDLGAGAGFPGVPIKIAWPSIELTLIEATAKKTAFLRALAETLALDQISVETGRAEELGHRTDLRGAFDLALARAVAPLPTLLELALPFVRVGGRLIAVKGSRAQAELAAAARALEILGGRPFTVPLDVPGPKQTIVAVLKQRETPPAYPRRAGVPRRSPL